VQKEKYPFISYQNRSAKTNILSLVIKIIAIKLRITSDMQAIMEGGGATAGSTTIYKGKGRHHLHHLIFFYFLTSSFNLLLGFDS
jgi:hypothetical protein